MGSYMHHYFDREGMIGNNGYKQIAIVERTTSRHQYYHPNAFQNSYQVRFMLRPQEIIKRNVDSGGIQRSPFDESIMNVGGFMTNTSNDKRFLKRIERDFAIEFLESMGFRYILLDDVAKPSVQNCMYFKHKLYAHNFPYLPNPQINRHHGDPDFLWKGTEVFDYSSYGATTSTPRNQFVSLWDRLSATLAKGVQAAGSGKKPAKE